MANTDPEVVSWVNVVAACFVVFGLIAVLGFVLKYINQRGLKLPLRAGQKPRRLEITESLTLDVRRRLVIVRCDGNEHLLLLGVNQDIVVDTNLKNTSPFETKSVQ